MLKCLSPNQFTFSAVNSCSRMDADKPTNQEAEEAELPPSQPESENETSTTAESETDAATAFRQNGEIEPHKVSNETPDNVEEVNKESENTEVLGAESKAPTEENKKSDSRPTRLSRATKRKASDADENENNTDTKESGIMVEQKENVDVKSQDSEPKENETVKAEEPSLNNLSTADGMGKGKRARIPNKRYSDIILSPNRKTRNHQKSLSEVLEPEMALHNKEEHTDSDVSSDIAPNNTSLRKRSRFSLPKEDLQDPKYLKPFKYGWKRELVWRATTHVGKQLGDIYYYNPVGKKLRSFREISDVLDNKQLSLDNFTFAREAIGLNDTEKEIVRDAKLNKSTSDEQPSSNVVKKKTKKVQSPKPDDALAPIPETSKVETIKSDLRGKKRGGSILVDGLSPEKRKKENSKQTPVETTAKQNSKKGAKMPAQKKGKETQTKRAKLAEDASSDPVPTQPSRTSPRKTRSLEAATPQPTTALPTKPVRRSLKLKNITNSATTNSNNTGETRTELSANFLGDCASIFNSLLLVFQYLKVQDLLRAGCVSRMWRAMADNPLLWRTVRMKNSQVHSFEGLANALKKHGTVHLDLRKMLLPSSGDDIWPDFSSAIARVDSLKKIEFCRCPASVVEQLATSNSHLEVINAVTIKCDSLNLDPFKSFTTLRELRLKSTSGLNINSIDSLSELKTLKILSLTSVIDLHKLNLSVIGELTNLESLDLGECLDFPENFGTDILLKLVKLEKLRLEKGQGNCHTFQILDSIKDMKKLDQLELVNFDVKPGFDKALGACKNIKKLMIIPTYISQSATTNNMVLAGVLRLHGTLAHFVWGVTLELLRVTELFIDQCEDTNKRDRKVGNNGDCIPVLKPVPDLSNGNAIQSASNPPQVEILPLPNLQKLLLNSLPTTRVKILKIPFHATWRQTLVDSL